MIQARQTNYHSRKQNFLWKPLIQSLPVTSPRRTGLCLSRSPPDYAICNQNYKWTEKNLATGASYKAITVHSETETRTIASTSDSIDANGCFFSDCGGGRCRDKPIGIGCIAARYSWFSRTDKNHARGKRWNSTDRLGRSRTGKRDESRRAFVIFKSRNRYTAGRHGVSSFYKYNYYVPEIVRAGS